MTERLRVREIDDDEGRPAAGADRAPGQRVGGDLAARMYADMAHSTVGPLEGRIEGRIEEASGPTLVPLMACTVISCARR